MTLIAATRQPLRISSQFDAGAIEVLSCEDAQAISLKIRPDTQAEFAQWFYFRLTGAAGQPCRITFENASECAFAEGWRGYQAVASYDKKHWFRVPTSYDGKVMTIEHQPEHASIYYAYFEPYSEERHTHWLGSLQHLPGVTLTDLGATVEGRPMTVVTVGSAAPGKSRIWIIARQHPGETMAEWFVEGLLKRLTGQGDWAGDAVVTRLREQAVFYIVPNMNPDGSVLGNLRTNAAGANLNREWMEPDAQRSPEVLLVRDAIHAAGCDMFFDIHGDEALPYVFVAGSEMLPNFDARQKQEQAAFVASFQAVSPDFQTQYGYSSDRYRTDALKLASKYISHTFGCLSLTLEMPFKDNANLPEPVEGWNGARSASLGAAMLGAILRQIETFPPGAAGTGG